MSERVFLQHNNQNWSLDILSMTTTCEQAHTQTPGRRMPNIEPYDWELCRPVTKFHPRSRQVSFIERLASPSPIQRFGEDLHDQHPSHSWLFLKQQPYWTLYFSSNFSVHMNSLYRHINVYIFWKSSVLHETTPSPWSAALLLDMLVWFGLQQKQGLAWGSVCSEHRFYLQGFRYLMNTLPICFLNTSVLTCQDLMQGVDRLERVS